MASRSKEGESSAQARTALQFGDGLSAGMINWRGGEVEAASTVLVPAGVPVTLWPWDPVKKRREIEAGEVAMGRILSLEEISLQAGSRGISGICINWPTSDGTAAVVAAHFPHVESIELENTQIARGGLRSMSKMTNLKRLCIYDASKLTFQDCRALAGAASLEHLRLSLLADAGDGLSALGDLPRLRTLDLSHGLKITDADLIQLAGLEHLEELDLRYCIRLTKRTLQTLASVPSLRRVNLSGTRIPAAAIADFTSKIRRRKVTTGSGEAKPPKPPKPRPPSVEEQTARRVLDKRLRIAIERRAVDLAVVQLRAMGCTKIKDVGATESWDLECLHAGSLLRVEVKGTQGGLGSVELTANEVEHARQVRDGGVTAALALVVCTDIGATVDMNDVVGTTGGNVHWFQPWSLDEAALRPTKYLYAVRAAGT